MTGRLTRSVRLPRLLVAGGVVAVAAVAAGPASGVMTADKPPPSASCPPASLGSGPNATGQVIAGYTLSAFAAGFRYQLNSRGLLPVGDPNEGNIMEADVPFTRTTVSGGPLIDSLAAAGYPGDTAAHLGSALGTFGAPGFPNDPVLAEAAYPPSPGHSADEQFGPATSSGGSGADAGSAHASADVVGGAAQSSVASSAFGPGGAGPALMAGGSSQSTTLARIGGGCVDSAATSATGAILIAGLIKIDGVTGTAAARSDGASAVPHAQLTVGNVTVGGLNAFIDRAGLHLAGQQPVGAGAVDQLQSVLQQTLTAAGMTIKLIGPQVTSNGASAGADSGGLDVTIDRPLPPLGVPGVPSLSLPGLPPVPLGTPGAPVHVEVVYGAARVAVNATTAPAPGSVPSSGGVVATPQTPTPGPSAIPPAAPNAPAIPGRPAVSVPARVDGSSVTSTSGGQTLVADSSQAPPHGSPVPVAWVVIGILGSIVAVGPMLGYARWQLLEGRI